MPPIQPAITGEAYYGTTLQQERLPQQMTTNGPIQAPIEGNHIRSISIRQLNHVYVVEVGCQVLAIENSSKLIALFAEYVADPFATEQKYKEGKLI